MSDDAELRQLRWRCRRGMKELDVALERYLGRDWPSASAQDKQNFQQLLLIEDPALYRIIIGKDPAPAELADVVARVQQA